MELETDANIKWNAHLIPDQTMKTRFNKLVQ